MQHCDCGKEAHRKVCAPRLMGSDTIEPTWGADGRQHTSMASYRNSLKAENNARGENFIELGNEQVKPAEYKFDEKGARDDIRAAMADIKAGKPVDAPVILED